ncbi:hypothetical protein JCM3770_001049 [Rhodotorula araucariae]
MGVNGLYGFIDPRKKNGTPAPEEDVEVVAPTPAAVRPNLDQGKPAPRKGKGEPMELYVDGTSFFFATVRRARMAARCTPNTSIEQAHDMVKDRLLAAERELIDDVRCVDSQIRVIFVYDDPDKRASLKKERELERFRPELKCKFKRWCKECKVDSKLACNAACGGKRDNVAAL